MAIYTFTAAELYTLLLDQEEDLAVLDVRNTVDFGRFKVEAPYPFALENISYFDFMEEEEECVDKVRDFVKGRAVYIICAKEGSAKYVAEILEKHGLEKIRYLEGGIKSWGNLLMPVLLNPGEVFALYQFIRPGKASCSYGLVAEKEMLLFDVSRNLSFYQVFAQEYKAKITKIFETHLQADYISGGRLLAQKTGAEIFVNRADFAKAEFDYTALKDKKNYGMSQGPAVTAIFTPGHTPGSTSYLIDDRFLISGDTVFLQSVGRPDLGGQVEAWANALFTTLQGIKEMDTGLFILPGHYMDWHEAQKVGDTLAFTASLGEVLEHNGSIYSIDDKNDFLEFIKSNMREQPEEYTTIRLINANLESVEDDKAEELDIGKNECAATAYKAQQEEKDN